MPETIEQLLFVIDLDQRFMPLLLAYGRHFTTDAHTYSGRRHEPKACFDNCGSIMVSYPERNLRYAEGYAVLANAPPLPFRHAWLVNADGVVRDPTLRAAKPAIEYFGIIFTTDYLCDVALRTNEFGIFQWDKNPMWDMTEIELQRVIHSKTSASCFKRMQTLARAYHRMLRRPAT